ncbi:DUF6069 family protein [Amycolatopsis sp. NPDC051061]|uniref:DUF6069 family protein n=1 Tax=Amycolatopsis sp. NPDC051061 TaxID=3155042 RepID=UPI0034263082
MAKSSGDTRNVVPRLAAAAVAAMVVNALVALIAKAIDTHGTDMGLMPAAYLSLTLIGVVVGALGWLLILRFRPSALRIVVPVALVITWIPDLLLLGQGATAGNVVGLMLMHVVVTAAVVSALYRTLPARREAAV